MLVFVYGFGDGLCNCLKHMVVSPAVVAFTRAVGQLLRMFSSVPFLGHKAHVGESALPQTWRFTGLGRMSYTTWTKNLIR